MPILSYDFYDFLLGILLSSWPSSILVLLHFHTLLALNVLYFGLQRCQTAHLAGPIVQFFDLRRSLLDLCRLNATSLLVSFKLLPLPLPLFLLFIQLYVKFLVELRCT